MIDTDFRVRGDELLDAETGEESESVDLDYIDDAVTDEVHEDEDGAAQAPDIPATTELTGGVCEIAILRKSFETRIHVHVSYVYMCTRMILCM